MENKDMQKKNVPVELEDDALNLVTGGLSIPVIGGVSVPVTGGKVGNTPVPGEGSFLPEFTRGK